MTTPALVEPIGVQRPKVCVISGAEPTAPEEFLAFGHDLGEALADAGAQLVFCGGGVGIMAAVIEGVAARRGSMTGFVPPDLMGTVKAVGARSHLYLVNSRAAGRDLTRSVAEGFVALPGGFDGMEELLATLACSRAGSAARPVVAANLNGYFDPVAQWLDRAVGCGLMTTPDRDLIRVADSPETVLRQLGMERDPAPTK